MREHQTWGTPQPDSTVGRVAGPSDAVPTDADVPEGQPFLMRVEDVFTITGRGVVVTGRVVRGCLDIDEDVEIVGPREKVTRTTVTAMELSRRAADRVQAGDVVGLLLRGIDSDDVERGQVVVTPGSITPQTELELY